MRLPLTLDLHLSNFTYPGVADADLFEQIITTATAAESSGFSSVSVILNALRLRSAKL